MRRTWNELPAEVRAAIERETGPVKRVQIPTAGRNSDFSATLHLADGVVFCKGIADAAGPRGRMHRHEADINPWLPPLAPRLRWRTETAGWLLLGFEHVTGQHANLAPHSPDLPVIAEAVTILARALANTGADAPHLVDQWARLAAWRRLAKTTPDDLDERARRDLDQMMEWEAQAIDLAAGNSLLHTDLHALNILVDGGQARVIDWAWSRRGSAAVDVAFLVIRLIVAGHTATEAEQWANTIPLWRSTPDTTRTAFAVAIWGIWEFLERDQPLPVRPPLTAAARTWAHHRLW